MWTIKFQLPDQELELKTIMQHVAELPELAADALMLLGWYDRGSDVGYPETYECSGDKPGWLAYAEGHGANLRIEVNEGSFVLLYLYME